MSSGDEAAVRAWLSANGLSEIADVLVNAGVDKMSDLLSIKESDKPDLANEGLKPMKFNRLLEAVNNAATDALLSGGGDGGGGGVYSEYPDDPDVFGDDGSDGEEEAGRGGGGGEGEGEEDEGETHAEAEATIAEQWAELMSTIEPDKGTSKTRMLVCG